MKRIIDLPKVSIMMSESRPVRRLIRIDEKQGDKVSTFVYDLAFPYVQYWLADRSLSFVTFTNHPYTKNEPLYRPPLYNVNFDCRVCLAAPAGTPTYEILKRKTVKTPEDIANLFWGTAFYDQYPGTCTWYVPHLDMARYKGMPIGTYSHWQDLSRNNDFACNVEWSIPSDMKSNLILNGVSEDDLKDVL